MGFSSGYENKLGFLIGFAVIYGLFFINYIDIASTGLVPGYHLWLVFMYFLPFVGFARGNIRNLKLTLGLGLLASLMNDVFYGFMSSLIHPLFNLARYYNLWLIPQDNVLFSLNLGFTVLPVYSWLMAFSIYIRITVVTGLLWSWKRGKTRQNRFPVETQTAWISRDLSKS
jgi:hypothetical protein